MISIGSCSLGSVSLGAGAAPPPPPEAVTINILDGEQATLVWDAPADSVRFYEITGDTSLDTTQTEAPFSVATGNLSQSQSAGTGYTFGIEADSVLVAVVTVNVLSPIAFVASIGTSTEDSADASIDVTTTAEINTSEFIVVRIGSDNLVANVGDNDDVLSVTVDPDGTPIECTKVVEATTGFADNPGDADGITCSVWMLAPGTTIATSATIRVTFDGSPTGKAVVVDKYAKDPRSTLLVGDIGEAHTTGANVADPPAVSTTLDTVAQRLYVYAMVREGAATTGITYSGDDWTASVEATGGSSGFEGIGIRGARRIAESLGSGDPGCEDGSPSTEYQVFVIPIEAWYGGKVVPSP
jgi:hypothetical protein